jgi:hypothetical protein
MHVLSRGSSGSRAVRLGSCSQHEKKGGSRGGPAYVCAWEGVFLVRAGGGS